MKVPFFILIAKEHAAAFRRGVELFCAYSDGRSSRAWGEMWMVIRPFVREHGYLTEPFHIDVPLTVDKALVWANSKPRPPADLLRQAGPPLEVALADWGTGWVTLGKFLKANRAELSDNHWIGDVVPSAIAAYTQAVKSLAEGWPVLSAEEEQKKLHEMKSGHFIELDDAFSRIAGVSKEEWSRRVDAHAQRHRPSSDEAK